MYLRVKAASVDLNKLTFDNYGTDTMAIDLPQALPPQLVTLQEIQSHSSSAPYVGTVNGHQLMVSGQHYLSNGELDRVMAAAKTTSQAIILMNAQVALKGRYLVSMTYAPDDKVVHVHAVQKQVSGVEGDGIAEYFDSLVGDKDLTRSEFDRARVMANVKSERVGVNYSSSFRIDSNGEGVTLVLNPQPVENHDATGLTLQLGNQGSRYVGRYFGDIGLSHNFRGGATASIAYEGAFTEWGESRDGEDYHRIQVGLDKPFSSGLYGMTASHVEYSQNLGSTGGDGSQLLCQALGALGLCTPASPGSASVDLTADINVVGLGGEQVLYSDIDYRFNLFEHLEYVDSQIEVDGFDSIQDEKYATLEFGAKYFAAHVISNQRLLRWSAQLSVKGGVTADDGTLGTYDDFIAANPGAALSSQVSPAARTAEFITLKPKLSINLPISDSGSLNFSILGQLSDEQVPQQQQWVLGGISSISAYLPGVLAGDSGYFGVVNYEHQIDLSGLKITGSVFAEYGVAWYENVSGTAGDERSIADAGVRFSTDFGWGVTLDAVAARNIADDGFEANEEIESLEADFYVVLKKVF
jgi:hypothetical protein